MSKKSTIRVLLTQGSNTARIQQLLTRLGADVGILVNSDKEKVAYAWATHVLIPGGPDIDPAYYDEPNRLVETTSPERDWLESGIVDKALLDKKPLMGICRGHQMIAVMAGGTLYQDISVEAGVHPHRSYHAVDVRHSKVFRALFNSSFGVVNSYHHQAVRDVPKGWKAIAHGRDGIIESISNPNYPVISVQWHPELLYDKASQQLFARFLALKKE